MRRIFGAFFVVLFSFFLLHSHARAQIIGEHIEQYDIKVTVNREGTIDVRELIFYDFDTLDRHGIYREIPLIKTNKEGKRFKVTLSNISVTDEKGEPYRYSSSISDNILRLKIGDPDKTITGRHEYVVTYRVAGALTYFSDHDELYWNLTGDHWTVPIANVTAKMSLYTKASSDLRSTCFTGSEGSTETDCTIDRTNQDVTITLKITLSAGEGMTAVFGFPKGMVAVLEPKEVINFSDTPIGKIIIAFLTVGLIIIALFWYIFYPLWIVVKWFMRGRDPKPIEGGVRAWYDPPTARDGRSITPAETGALVDETADLRDILALVVDLARRGYIVIKEKTKGKIRLVKQKEVDSGMLPYEKKFFRKLFEGEDEVDITNNDLVAVVNETKDSLHKLLVDDGFFDHNPKDTRTFYGVIAGLALSTFNIHLFIIALLFGRNMPKKTQSGSDAAAKARSLRNFLSSQERQLEFQAKKQYFFEKLLPFAVAFGIESVWIKRLIEIGVHQPGWYQGYSGYVFTADSFSRSMSGSYANLSSAVTPTSSSSGFSSGFSGGSSGGGGGGGGGGSW